MITNNNQIIHDMHIEDLTQLENFDKIGFEVGSICQEYETFKGTQFGETYCYIKSAGIYFPISKDSVEMIVAKMARLVDLKKYVEEAEEVRAERKQGGTDKDISWRYVEIPLFSNEEIRVPKEARGMERNKYGITWFEPYKEEKVKSVEWGDGDPGLREEE